MALFPSARTKPLKARFEPFKIDLFRNYGFLSLVAWGFILQFAYLVGLYVISRTLLASHHIFP